MHIAILAIFFDILSLMHWLSFSLQPDKHNPEKKTRCFNKFTWTVAKLRLVTENSLNENDDEKVITFFKTFCWKVKNADSKSCYQGI